MTAHMSDEVNQRTRYRIHSLTDNNCFYLWPLRLVCAFIDIRRSYRRSYMAQKGSFTTVVFDQPFMSPIFAWHAHKQIGRKALTYKTIEQTEQHVYKPTFISYVPAENMQKCTIPCLVSPITPRAVGSECPAGLHTLMPLSVSLPLWRQMLQDCDSFNYYSSSLCF